jgi:HK97 family phage major capsid protein
MKIFSFFAAVIAASLIAMPAHAADMVHAVTAFASLFGDPSHGVAIATALAAPIAAVAEQITAFEQKRAGLVAANDAIMQKAAGEGRTLDASEEETFDGNQADIDAVDKHLGRLRSMEKSVKMTPVGGKTAEEGAQSRQGQIIVKAPPKLDPGIGFARLARVKAIARLDGESPRELAKMMYGEESETYGAFVKAAVPAGTTGGWAAPLVGADSAIFADFVEFLRPQTILGKFGTSGVPSLRRVPFRTALIGQTSGGAGYWVGEGNAKPLTKFDFSRTTLDPLKVANIAVVTEEVLRDSSPSAEGILRDSLAGALKSRLDTDFIDPAKAAVAGVSPASILNGLAFIISGGNTADAVRDDVRRLFAAFIAANNAPTSGVWIMPASTALALSLLVNPLGQPEFPGISMNGGTFYGLPVIVSEYVPTAYDPDGAGANVAGAVIALVNAQDIYFADDGDVAVDMSREASLEMSDAPAHDADTPTPSQLVSLWQTNAVGFRAERTLNWKKRRASAVAALASVNWGE